MNGETSVIEIHGLTKYYGKTVGIEDLDLDVYQGEIFGFLGQNGAGKTTTIRCLMSILLPTSGEAKINGTVISRKHPEIRDEIGYLPGEITIPGHYKAKDFLNYIATLRGKPSSRMNEIATLFDLPMEKRISQLSKGNKQKLGIVLAFMSNPLVYILDEPTSGLDPIYQQILFDLLLEEKSRGKTIFFSSHNLDEVQRICDRVAIIREGKLVRIEQVRQLANQVARRLTAQFGKLSDEDIEIMKGSGLSIVTKDMDRTVLEIAIHEGMLNQVLDVLNEFEVLDLSYPPASLEEYFLSAYQEV